MSVAVSDDTLDGFWHPAPIGSRAARPSPSNPRTQRFMILLPGVSAI
jgi:hypothetical protein